MPPPPLLLLSGFAADERVFLPQLAEFPQLTVPRWIAPRRGESLPGYAKRLAEVVNPGTPCYVGGLSFGGMVAVEMARHLDALACFLIASVRSSKELPSRLRCLKPAAALLPEDGVRLATWLAAATRKVGGHFLSPLVSGSLDMASKADPALVCWSARAVLSWPEAPPPPLPIFQIHGARDRVLPARLTRPDVLLPDAGHLLTVTHSPQVNAFLRTYMAIR
jgi:pimeloyl-ACP methyl ester carboxylesterase